MNCSICGKKIIPHPLTEYAEGNNAQPVNDGRCCDGCDQGVVIPRRMANAMQGKDPYEGKGLW